MAIAIDKANAGTAANDTAATSIAVNTTQVVAAGGFIVASVGLWSAAGPTLSTVTGGSLSWTIAIQGRASSNAASAIVWAQAPSGLASGTTITATYSTSVNGRQIGITSFTGVATSSPVDTTAALTQANTAAWASSSATIAAGSVLVGCCHLDTTGTSTITSPSIEALDWTDGSDTAATTGYRIEAAGGSFTIAGAWGGAGNHATVAAAFLAAAGGGGTTVKQLAALGVG